MATRLSALMMSLLISSSCQVVSTETQWTTVLPESLGLRVVWLFDTNECLTCQGVDGQLRELRRTFGEQIPIVALHVGLPNDHGIPSAFLRRNRIAAEIITVEPGQYRDLRGPTLPKLVLVEGQEVVWTYGVQREGSTRTQTIAEAVPAFLTDG